MIKHNAKLAIWEFLQSILAALGGVQSEKKRQQDFVDDNLLRIISVCFVAAVVLVLIVLVMVNIAMPEVK
jgi:hypothetical protein